ncbi:MAG: UDP-N-acetylmuramoyl-tripeptide--D-alanyl-D-alanine ligase [Candidatus Binatus sp.]|uniref:UDP-N-acetylmuramoyl-tripeptide--D-alanyl-D- alanine ligase n=1 Tax=Candidatus Binatus sp. TaxID=2811406 RepID=UPI002717790D|nr:UDP-N-acetylmuramoyl-tripeptide--D-alanyl-D-alanine ligase [Candidatus Binatus sp.]MDO8433499.1 UDP-N-acetylmuramoyl-tripeptide--D-alanyl-D-alanine ligase [Candidatus Binatus sp.]
MATPIPGNQCEFTLAEIAAATGAQVRDDLATKVRGVSIDTRAIATGALFVALRGESRDGHDHLDQAIQRGAAAAIVESGRHLAGIVCVEVPDTLVALGQLAQFHLARMRSVRLLPTIAIGGAAGKTTTKELTAAAARTVFGDTLATVGNLNNRIGVPMTIFTLASAHRAAVLECGTNLRGEIDALAQIVQPDCALVLNVDLEHTAGIGTLDDVADEEAALFSTTRRCAITSSEEPLVLARIPARLQRLTFGKSPDSDVRLESRTVGANGRARIRIALGPALCRDDDARRLDLQIDLLGETAALNCAAAIAGVAAMRGEPLTAGELRAIADALAVVQPVAGRLATSSIRGIRVIDDTYNSNPRSIRAALAAAREVADGLGARLVIAMGDMLELGAMSREAHEASVRDVIDLRPAAFVAVGPEMCAAKEVIAASSTTMLVTAPDSAAAAKLIASIVRAGDVLLIKGSRGMAMERILDSLRTP